MKFFTVYYYFLLIVPFHFMLLASNTQVLRKVVTGNLYKRLINPRVSLQNRFFFSWSGSSSSSGSSNAGPSYGKYNVAVSYNSKTRKEELDLDKYPAGEDNYVLKQRDNGDIVIGVADGVGGWSETEGCNSADISKELCSSISDIFSKKNYNNDIVELLDSAYHDVKDIKKVRVGGTTICFGIVNAEESSLKVLNVGDSWCGQFRNFKCIKQTKFQTLGFNTPYQLSIIPNEYRFLYDERTKKMRKIDYIEKMAKDGDVYDFKLNKDDIIIFATDGVTDNVIPEDIELFLKDKYSEDKEFNLQKFADSLVAEVTKLSKNHLYPSPFSQEMSAVYNRMFYGGKQDDITITVLQVK